MALTPNLFWQHLVGDSHTGPCVHLTQQHPGGDSTTIPCTHLTKQHPGGDPSTIPCVHRNLAGQPKHPGGDPGPTTPCVHVIQLHPGGDPGPTVPCTHLVPRHPGGDTVFTPCAHPMIPTRHEFAGNVIFYTNNTELQDAVINAVQRLLDMGIHIAAPRPLNIFNHNWVDGFPQNGKNPAWSHYSRVSHSIQITANRTGTSLTDALHHEMGHALLGHSCVWITSPGGSHSLTGVSDPALAMSEGWAHFVALAIENNDPNSPGPISYQGQDWENMSISANANIEYCVGCCLWDLFDSPKHRVISRHGGRVGMIPSTEGGTDQVALSFKELFKVYSPTLSTLADGPQIPNVADYIERLKQNNRGIAADIDSVKVRNVG